MDDNTKKMVLGTLTGIAMQHVGGRVRRLLDDMNVQPRLGEAVLLELVAISMAQRPEEPIDSEENMQLWTFFAATFMAMRESQLNPKPQENVEQAADRLQAAAKLKAEDHVAMLKKLCGIT